MLANKNKKIGKILSLMSLAILPIAAISASCQKRVDDNALTMDVTKASFKNFNKEYTIKDSEMSIYRIKDQQEMMYIDLDEFLKNLEGLFDNKVFSTRVSLDDNKKFYEIKDEKKQVVSRLVVDWKNNKIITTSTSFFYEIQKPQEQTNDGQFLETTYESKKDDPKSEVVFDLGKYKMDILYKDNKVLLPFLAFNTLFMSWTFNNIYWNGKNLTNVQAGVDAYKDTPKEAKERIRKDQEIKNKEQTKKEREINFNHLMFTMDNFYGLKYHKEIKSFEEWIGPEYKQKLLSTKPAEFHQAYIDIFHKKLNELHTRLNTLSYYEEYNEKETTKQRLLKNKEANYGQYFNDFGKIKADLVQQFEKKFNKKIDQFGPEDYIRYHGNTAIVTTFGFQDGTKEQLDKEDEAWKYDTYYLMRHLMKQIEERNKKAQKKEKEGNKEIKEIKNIVLDLSLNGGGSVSSMVRVLGFMTDKEVLNREYNIVDKRGDLSKSKVDTDGDQKYDNDAYTKYTWSLLVGLNTFSAANQLTSIVKEMGIAKIIGKQTGGGMSAIMPIMLNDGTTITISGPNNAVFGEKNESIEGGIKPDINLEYKDFYNDEAIDKALNAATTTPKK
ncbi:Hypothetical protein, predicted lipoprotein [Metamycoplasma auris 15026]|uniref:Tail specific protease domain-containing protein n=1 Tax=Metamycoplasma auris 15026 TaxID=1188233 RepID=N9TS13_9BACT|nr:S41 family peptidase [Metamycoplasma auris]ENY68865.1 Hypothetical protein, predicted lipoprotein [Metamycoplasma auris 15026]